MMRLIRPSAPLHLEPDSRSNRETDILFGEAVTIHETAAGFSQVTLKTDGYPGWVETAALGEAPAPDHVVCTPRALMTASPDIKSSSTGWLPMAAQVSASPAAPEVMAIHGHDGVIGHIPAHHLMPLEATVADWVAVAESLIGTPYRWGGRDGIGLDCSALVQLALSFAGIRAKRNSSDQEKTLGHTIDPAAGLERGDLVFWKGHVGIMANPETLLHANMHHAMTASEPLAEAITRLEGLGLPVTRFARL
ncbi:MAG: NlpC/P60 family protein [Candidatus Puniceispirillales bacterium]